MKLVFLGGGHHVMSTVVTTIINYGSRPAIRLKQEFDKNNKAIDLTCGEKLRTLILCRDGYLLLSNVKSDTLSKRFDAALSEK